MYVCMYVCMYACMYACMQYVSFHSSSIVTRTVSHLGMCAAAVHFLEYECAMHLMNAGADIRAVNTLRQRPIIMTDDTTMIRMLTAFEKNTPLPSPAPPHPHLTKLASIKHTSRDSTRASWRSSLVGEAKSIYMNINPPES